MFQAVRRLLELIRFSHTLFALPFALLSAAVAWRREGVLRVIDLVGILPRDCVLANGLFFEVSF